MYVARNQDDSSNEGLLYSILRPFNIRSRTSKDRFCVALTYNGKYDLRRYRHAGEYEDREEEE